MDTTPISDEDVSELIEAMRLAPSCNNNQPWRVIVARDPDALRSIKAALPKGNSWALKAPLIFAICARSDDDCKLADRRDLLSFQHRAGSGTDAATRHRAGPYRPSYSRI